MIEANSIYTIQESKISLDRTFLSLNQFDDSFFSISNNPNLKRHKGSMNNIISLALENLKKKMIEKKDQFLPIKNNQIKLHPKICCSDCSSYPLLSMKYESTENFYDLKIKTYCENNHESKVNIKDFLSKNIKSEISENTNTHFDVKIYNNIKEKINAFTNNLNLIKEIGIIIDKQVKELNQLIKSYVDLNNLEINFTNLLLENYKYGNLNEKYSHNIIELLNFNDNFLEQNYLDDMQLFDYLFFYLNRTKNCFLKENGCDFQSCLNSSTNSNESYNDIKNLQNYKLQTKFNQKIKKILFLNSDVILMINQSIIFYDIKSNKNIFEIKENGNINDIIKLNNNLIVYNVDNIIKINNIDLSLSSNKIIQTINSHKLTINKIINSQNGFITCSKDNTFKIFSLDLKKDYKEIQSTKAHNKEITSILLYNNDNIITASHKEKMVKLFKLKIIKILNLICNDSRDCLFNLNQNTILIQGIDTLYLVNGDFFTIEKEINTMNINISYINIYDNFILMGDSSGNLIQYINKGNDVLKKEKSVITLCDNDNKINFITQLNDYIIVSLINGEIQILKYEINSQ